MKNRKKKQNSEERMDGDISQCKTKYFSDIQDTLALLSDSIFDNLHNVCDLQLTQFLSTPKQHTPMLVNISPADACIHNKLVSAFAMHNLLGPVPGAVKEL